MTKRLEQVIARVGILPEAEQDAIAEIVLAEIEAEHRWEAAIAKSPEKLGRLADKAWREHEAGQSRELDPEKL
ncbi:MAG TPA: hypothetical protein VHX86_13265 [Tepidisphaeraceae bacterium]|jgi:hypothetical protein|nr:hypothetical protein [Tepidisphaeraceae bacterium]